MQAEACKAWIRTASFTGAHPAVTQTCWVSWGKKKKYIWSSGICILDLKGWQDDEGVSCMCVCPTSSQVTGDFVGAQNKRAWGPEVLTGCGLSRVKLVQCKTKCSRQPHSTLPELYRCNVNKTSRTKQRDRMKQLNKCKRKQMTSWKC